MADNAFDMEPGSNPPTRVDVPPYVIADEATTLPLPASPSSQTIDGIDIHYGENPDLSRINVNSFAPYQLDDRFRPYNTVAVDRDDVISTIVIMEPSQTQQPENPSTDFFNSFAPIAYKVTPNPDKDKVVQIYSNFYGVFQNFSLLDIGETSSEAVKVTLNFGLGWTAYFFGQQPRIYNFSGVFLDAKNYPFYEQFMTAYKTHLCGSEVARKGYRFYIAYDGKICSGYMLGITVGSNSGNKTIKNFTFQVLIDNEGFFRTNMFPYNDPVSGAMNNIDLLK